jgi:hypothetical protein
LAPDFQTKSKQQNKVVSLLACPHGLEAFSELLKNLPIQTGMAFVFVQHLDPRLFYEMGDREWVTPDLRSLLEDVLPNNSWVQDVEISQKVPRTRDTKAAAQRGGQETKI